MADNSKQQNQSAMMRIMGIVLVAILALGGVLLLGFNDNSSTTNNEASVTQSTIIISEDGTQVSYSGLEGQSALALLKQNADTGTEEFSGLGEYVVSINGVVADSTNNYWAFYVNGEAAQVGAGDYITQDGDVVEWRLEDVSTFTE